MGISRPATGRGPRNSCAMGPSDSSTDCRDVHRFDRIDALGACLRIRKSEFRAPASPTGCFAPAGHQRVLGGASRRLSLLELLARPPGGTMRDPPGSSTPPIEGGIAMSSHAHASVVQLTKMLKNLE